METVVERFQRKSYNVNHETFQLSYDADGEENLELENINKCVHPILAGN